MTDIWSYYILRNVSKPPYPPDIPELRLGLIEEPGGGTDVEENDLRVSFDQPTAVGHLDTAGTHSIDRATKKSGSNRVGG